MVLEMKPFQVNFQHQTRVRRRHKLSTTKFRRPIGVLRPIKPFIVTFRRPMGGRHRIGNSIPILLFPRLRSSHWVSSLVDFRGPPWLLHSSYFPCSMDLGLVKMGSSNVQRLIVFCPCFHLARRAAFSLSLSASLWKPLFFTSVFVWSLESTVYGSACLEAVIAPKLSLCGSVYFLRRSLISSLRMVFCLVVFPVGFQRFLRINGLAWLR